MVKASDIKTETRKIICHDNVSKHTKYCVEYSRNHNKTGNDSAFPNK